MKQLDMLVEYKAYQRSSDTSKSAWENKKNKITLKDEVLQLFNNGNYANHQIAEMLEQPLSSICARIRELQIEDKLVDSGKRVKSKYNRDCVLWEKRK